MALSEFLHIILKGSAMFKTRALSSSVFYDYGWKWLIKQWKGIPWDLLSDIPENSSSLIINSR